jgi:peroxiredoxin
MRIFLVVVCAALSVAGQDLSNRRAPSFSLPDSALKQYDILDYRGKWLIVEFMKTDCLHCRNLTKTLEEQKTRMGGNLAALAIVLIPTPETTATVAKYIAETKTTTPILFDSSQVAMGYFKATPQHASFDTPHWFLIDPNGMIVKDWGQGSADTKDWVKEMDAAMARKK